MSPTDADLQAIMFGDNDRQGFAVGASGTAIKSTDGGITWFPILQGLEGQQLGDVQPHKLPAPWYYLSWLLVGLVALPALRKPDEKELKTEETIANVAVSDRPLEPDDPDPLGYRELALATSKFLRNENTVAPITIAITGNWGTGKSSIMNLLRRDLAARGLRPIWFNAWHNQTEDDLFATILQAVRKQGVPQWWELDYVGFRARLLGARLATHLVPATILLAIVAFLAAYEWQHVGWQAISQGGLLTALKNHTWKPGTFWVFLVAVAVALKRLYDGLKAFGVDPASLLASRSGSKSLGDLEKQTALRQRFADELRDVTRALGPRQRIVLFVDDLDRCMPDNIRVVLEAINFIVTSGECFVIMGLSRDPVEAGVGLSFEKIAGEMSFAAAASSLSMEDQAKLKRREFARQYLDKLINIEIPARPTSSAKFENLVLDNAGPKSSAATVRERSLSVLKIVLPVVVSLFVICGLAVAGFQIGRLGQKGSTQEASNTNVQKHISAGNGGAAGSGDAGTNTPAASPAPPTTAVLPSLVPPEQTSNEGFTYVWPLLGTALLLYVCWRVLSRKEEVLVRDSPEFRRALEIWDTLIVNTHSTPRSTKRFMNRVRCLAMRLRPSAEAEPRWRFLWNWPNPETPGSTFPSTSQLPESMLVALSTIYDLAPEAIRNDDLYAKAMQGLLKPLSQGEVGVNAKIESVYEGALKHHQQQFPGKWPPNSEQRKLFLEMVADVTVRG